VDKRRGNWTPTDRRSGFEAGLAVRPGALAPLLRELGGILGPPFRAPQAPKKEFAARRSPVA